ncbi:MAG: glycosyltransferase family 4 protein [Caulobacteraceae bacterium]|nr:glycosyltransferase family 4 protein [Caulobacter sp.]
MAASPAGPDVAHVLLTTDAVGGVWTYALDLARGLAARGDRVTLAVLGPPPDADRRAAAMATGAELVDTGLPLDWLAADAGEVRAAGEALAALAERVGADLVHLNSPALAACARFRRPVVGVAHSCLRTWWAAVEGETLEPADFRWRADLLAQGYALCDALVAPTAAFAEATARAYGVRPAVVRNGRSPPVAGAGVAKRRQVLTAGRLWDRGKDLATLDAAAALIDAPVLALGPTRGPDGGEVRPAHVVAVGETNAHQLASALALARVFASPALYEPFGLAVLEAAQAGCALVLCDIPTFRELWEGAAVFVPARDPAALAAALQRLLDDEAEAARLGSVARERAHRYGLDAFVDGVRAVHRQALAVRAPEGAAA